MLKGLKRIPKVDHKSYPTIMMEIASWMIEGRGGINKYLDYSLFARNKKPGDYLQQRSFNSIAHTLNSPEYYPILEDKYFFHQIVEGKGFRVPRNLYMIDHSRIFDMQSSTYITVEAFLSRDADTFCKLNNGYGGNMVFPLRIQNGALFRNDVKISTDEFFKILDGRKFIIQQRIIQHDDLQKLNPSCINTMRMLTINRGNDISLFQLYMRIGINGHYVDNGISGNISVGIDAETGKLMKHAYLFEYANEWTKHPDTNVVFDGFQLPYFREAKEMVIGLHVLFQHFFMIGWDIGITPEGPIVIEGNNIATFYPYQMLYGGLKKPFFDCAESYRKYQSQQ